MSTNNYIAKLRLRLDQAIIQRDHWKQLAYKRDYIEVKEIDPDSRTESVWRVDADSVRRMWAQIRQIEAALAECERLKEALEKIEKFGHGSGHGRGFTCANIAASALSTKP